MVINKEELNKLSKDELINIIDNLQNKYSIDSQEIQSLNIDYIALLEAASDIIIVLDKEGKLVYRNSSPKGLYPKLGKESIGKHYFNYLPDMEKERARFVFDSVIKSGTAIEDELIKTFDEDGNTIYLLTSFSPIKSSDNIIVGLVGIMKNITDRHLMEKKLRDNSRILEERVKEYIRQSDELKELRDFNEEIINNAPIGIFIMDPTGIMLKENPSLIKIMGRTPNESVVGVNLLNHPGFNKAGFDKLFEEVLREKETVRVYNRNYIPIAGDREIIINVIMHPVFDKNGSVDKVIVMVEDNTENAKIAKRANKAERLSSLVFLASGIASELRGHVNNMSMDLNFVENNVDENRPEAEYIDSLKDELGMIKIISEQLMSLSITGVGDKETSELSKILTNHPIDLILNRLKNDGYIIEIDIPDNIPYINASQNELQQLMIQLIENAEDAMPEKGKITISADSLDTAEGCFVTISISDTGIGIPEENIKRIFQPFFTTKGKKATGLGLMIVSTIIENLGGVIAVKSIPGEGTTFRLAIHATNEVNV